MVAYRRFAIEAKGSEGARQHREALGLDACNVSKVLTHTIVPPTKLVPCARSLVMADLNAVDHVTGAQENVLLSGGALPPDKRLRHGQPIPMGDLLQALVIDDHVVIVAGTGLIDSRVQNMAAEFDSGTDACATAGLPQHPTKHVRGDVNAVILGAKVIDGQTIGSERVRRIFLAVISLMLAPAGRAHGAVLRCLLASWTYCSLLRGPSICFVGDSFKQLPKVANDAFVCAIPKETPKI